MRTLYGVRGAGSMPAQPKAPRSASRSVSSAASLRGARTAARAPRAISAGTVERSSSAWASSWAAVGAGRGTQAVGAAGVSAESGAGVEQHGGDVDAGDAVDERVVGLADDREAVARQPLDEPQLPQRLVAVQRLGEQATGQPLQRGVVARARQPGVAQVVADVEVRVVDPGRAALPERHGGQALAVAGHEIEPAADVVDELGVARRTALEDEHLRDVHVRLAIALEMQEGGVEPGQPVGVAHRAIVVRGGGLGKLQHAV